MTALRLAGVSKVHGTVPALRALDLEVADGELVTVLGPSGSGKSTLLRLVAGLDPVSSGRIWLGDRDVTGLSPGRRNVSMVFQSFALFPHLTVRQNIDFGLVVRDTPRAEARERAREAAEMVGCADLLDRRPGQLSGGERQRVALARALVRRPAVFLLDEPLSNLDAELRVQVRGELAALHRRLGATMVHVTHDQTEALSLGQRVAVLRDGLLQQLGTPAELWERPANRFVARFVGVPPMSFLARGDTPLAGLALPDDVEVGVRPEAVRLGPGGAAARVTAVERVGADAHVHLACGDASLVARLPAEAAPSPGADTGVHVRPQDLHLFDVTTGDRVAWT
jgi:ABC-type sugar transport system ATPase subunit